MDGHLQKFSSQISSVQNVNNEIHRLLQDFHPIMQINATAKRNYGIIPLYEKIGVCLGDLSGER